VGKLFIAKEILEKPGKLDESEWNLMKNHSLHGALFLSGQPEVSKLAPIAAYEHHMQYDGNGYPTARRSTQKQHIISQIIAISDIFDAMRSKRIYQSSKQLLEVIRIIKESSGTYLNPELVDNFLNAFKKVRVI
jgi:HD-GYP domain-containing protein (c-di-GMP phosphodiesterase class II)